MVRAASAQPEVAGNPSALSRRLLSLSYEALLLCAVLFCAALPFAVVEARLDLLHLRALFQVYLATVAGIYFVWHWARAGQTLPMKTWRLRLVGRSGGSVTAGQAMVRYLAALVGLALLGLTFLWALVDREGAFLHDRIAGTRIVQETRES